MVCLRDARFKERGGGGVALDVWYRPDDAHWVAVIAGYGEECFVVVQKILGEREVIKVDGEEFLVKGFGGAVGGSFNIEKFLVCEVAPAQDEAG